MKIMTSVEKGVINLCRTFKQFLVDYLACERVPEMHHVESVNCGKNYPFLLPYEIAIIAN